MCCELRPAIEPVALRYQELRTGQGAASYMLIEFAQLLPPAQDSLRILFDLSSSFACIRQVLEARNGFGPSCSPGSHRSKLSCLTRVLEILSELLVLFNVGARR
jgi:hypothetical protein